MTQAIEKSAMSKIYMRLLPFAILSYFLACVDRINVSFAALTMRDDLQMSASAYGFALGTFYWAYFIFEVPSNIVMEKVGARLWIARIMITWGLLACATAYVTGATSFGIGSPLTHATKSISDDSESNGDHEPGPQESATVVQPCSPSK